MKKTLAIIITLALGLSLGAQPRQLSVKEFLKLSPNDTSSYIVKGVVSQVRSSSSGSFYLKDNTSTMLVYGIQDPANPAASFKQMNIMRYDTLTVQGRFTLYAGQTKEMKDGRLLAKADGPEHGKSFMERLDKQPSFKGKEGKAAFDTFEEWVRAQVKKQADGAKGAVVVSYAVGKNGKVQEVQIYKGANQELNEEVMRVVKSSPKWKPAVMDGSPVRLNGWVRVEFE
jgi:TonB family protein